MTNTTKNKLLPDGFNLKSFLEAQEHKNFESPELMMRLRKKYGDKTSFLIEQLKLYNKAKVKLPFHSENFCLFTSKSFEQSSSEMLAEFKQRKFKGYSLLDLTGGLGIDDWALSKSFTEIVSVDSDTRLNEIVRYNLLQTGIDNIKRIDADAYEFVKENLCFDMIYVDSDRRSKQNGKKAVTLHDNEPSIIKLQNRLFEISDTILLKLSPLVDITYLANTLNNVSKIYVVSLNNEVKEILVLMKKTKSEKIEIFAIDINRNGTQTEFVSYFEKSLNEEYTTDGKYFYEPSNVLIKSGLAVKYAVEKGLKTAAKNSLYVLSDKFIKDFFGRKFIVVSKIPFSKSGAKRYLKLNNINNANVSKRNFTLSAGEIMKLFSLSNGGENYLFFTIDSEKQKLMFHCIKV
jgi:hypothetical protein